MDRRVYGFFAITLFIRIGCAGLGGHPQRLDSTPERDSVWTGELIHQLCTQWQGSAQCYDHGPDEVKDIDLLEFRMDSTWLVDSGSKKIGGTWIPYTAHGKTQIKLYTVDSPWQWNGPWSVALSDTVLMLRMSRPWQVDCHVRVHRIKGVSD